MGKPAISYLMDKQTEISLAYCPRCGGEIYRYDPVGDLGGCLVHEDCMTVSYTHLTLPTT